MWRAKNICWNPPCMLHCKRSERERIASSSVPFAQHLRNFRVCVCVCVCELSRLLKIVVIRDCRCSKFRDSRLSLERCCVLLIFSCFFVTFSAMVFKVFVQEKVRSTWRLVEVACFSRCPARFFASFPALSKAKIDGNDFKSAKFAGTFFYFLF